MAAAGTPIIDRIFYEGRDLFENPDDLIGHMATLQRDQDQGSLCFSIVKIDRPGSTTAYRLSVAQDSSAPISVVEKKVTWIKKKCRFTKDETKSMTFKLTEESRAVYDEIVKNSSYSEPSLHPEGPFQVKRVSLGVQPYLAPTPPDFQTEEEQRLRSELCHFEGSANSLSSELEELNRQLRPLVTQQAEILGSIARINNPDVKGSLAFMSQRRFHLRTQLDILRNGPLDTLPEKISKLEEEQRALSTSLPELSEALIIIGSYVALRQQLKDLSTEYGRAQDKNLKASLSKKFDELKENVLERIQYDVSQNRENPHLNAEFRQYLSDIARVKIVLVGGDIGKDIPYDNFDHWDQVVKALTTQADSLEARQESIPREIQRHQDALSQAKREEQSAASEYDGLKAPIGELTAQLREVENQLDPIQKKITPLTVELERKTQELGRVQAEKQRTLDSITQIEYARRQPAVRLAVAYATVPLPLTPPPSQPEPQADDNLQTPLLPPSGAQEKLPWYKRLWNLFCCCFPFLRSRRRAESDAGSA